MRRLEIVSAVVIAALCLVCCDKGGRVPQGGITPGGGHGETPGGNPERPDKPEETTYTFNAASSEVTYVSTGYDDKKALFDVYDIVLSSAGVKYDDSYDFSGTGAAVAIELNTVSNEGKILRVADGKYPVSADFNSLERCVYPGEESSGSMYPTYIYYCPEGTSEGRYYLVTEGSLNVSQNSNGSYSLNATFLTEVAQFVFNYNGTPDFYYIESYNRPPLAGTPDERNTYRTIEVSGYNGGAQLYYGSPYDIKKSGYSNWDVQLYEPDSTEDDGWLKIELCSTEVPSNTKLPAGDYLCRTPKSFSESTLVPFSLVPGSYEYDESDGDQYYSTWYFDADHPYDDYGRYYSYVLTDGSVKVSLSGSTYTIEYTLYDDEDCYILKGKSVVDALNYVDCTQSSTSAVPSRKAATVHRYSPSPRRNFAVKGRTSAAGYTSRAVRSCAARAL